MRKKVVFTILVAILCVGVWRYHTRMPDYRTAIAIAHQGDVSQLRAIMYELIDEIETLSSPGNSYLDEKPYAWLNRSVDTIWLADPQEGRMSPLIEDSRISDVLWSPLHDRLLYTDINSHISYIVDIKARKKTILTHNYVPYRWYDNDHVIWVEDQVYPKTLIKISDMEGNVTELVRQKRIDYIECDPSSGIIIYGSQRDLQQHWMQVTPYIINPRKQQDNKPQLLSIAGSSDPLFVTFNSMKIEPGGSRVAYQYFPEPYNQPSKTRACIRKLNGLSLAEKPEYDFAPDEYPGEWHPTRNALLGWYKKDFNTAPSRFYPFLLENGVKKQLQPEEQSDIYGINLYWAPDGKTIVYAPIYDAPSRIHILDSNGKILREFKYPYSLDGCELAW